MPIKIFNWLHSDKSTGLANVELNGVGMDVLVKCSDIHKIPLNESLLLELDFDELISISIETEKCDSDSIILKRDDHYEIFGKIISLIECDPESSVFDVYVQNGPEFIAFISAPGTFQVNDFVFLKVKNLCCFPVST